MSMLNTITKLTAEIGGGTLHSLPPGPKICGGTCLRASMASPPMLCLLYKARQRKRHSSSVAVKPQFLKVGLIVPQKLKQNVTLLYTFILTFSV